MFIHFAEAWCRFRGRFVEAQPVPRPYSGYVDDFLRFLRDERGLSPVTMTIYRLRLINFFESVWRPAFTLSALSVKDVDIYLADRGNQGWIRASLHCLASTLRTFFRYAEGKGWCRAIAAAIEAPRVFAQESLPLGPTWVQVQQLITSTAGDRAVDIRNHAILLLLAVYGLRRGEVAGLRLDDVDWRNDMLHVTRPKQRCTHQYPLVASVGNAILRYLQEARPRSAHRALFMTLHAPIRPLRPASITPIVHSRLVALGMNLPGRGAHCLRHACAQHLLANGFSLKQIGDQLGHRSATVTQHYAKVDLDGLREVAELDLEGLL
jgi:site-specific recombinase XerD